MYDNKTIPRRTKGKLQTFNVSDIWQKHPAASLLGVVESHTLPCTGLLNMQEEMLHFHQFKAQFKIYRKGGVM